MNPRTHGAYLTDECLPTPADGMTSINQTEQGVTALIERWERIADEKGVRTFTGNDHRLFANELRAALSASPTTEQQGVYGDSRTLEAVTSGHQDRVELVALRNLKNLASYGIRWRFRDEDRQVVLRAIERFEQLEAKCDSMREALHPFAKYARDGGVEGWNDLEFPPNIKDFVSLGDFRRARAALTQEGQGEA